MAITFAELRRDNIAVYRRFKFNRVDASLLEQGFYCEDVISAENIDDALMTIEEEVDRVRNTDYEGKISEVDEKISGLDRTKLDFINRHSTVNVEMPGRVERNFDSQRVVSFLTDLQNTFPNSVEIQSDVYDLIGSLHSLVIEKQILIDEKSGLVHYQNRKKEILDGFNEPKLLNANTVISSSDQGLDDSVAVYLDRKFLVNARDRKVSLGILEDLAYNP